VANSVDEGDLPFLANPITRIVLFVSYVLLIILMFFTIIRLKRVEADDDYFYVTNYLKTYRYSKNDIVSTKTSNYLIFKITTITMKEKTKMGKKIRYIGDLTTHMV
jgi:hypothetical protein